MSGRWFANRGQIVQAIAAVVSASAALVSLYFVLKSNNSLPKASAVLYVSTGVFVLLVGIWIGRRSHSTSSLLPEKAYIPSDLPEVVAGRIEFKNLIPAGERNSFLLKEASHLHWRGLDELSILTAVVDICKRFCEEGENYAKRKEANLKTMVAWVAKHPYTRLVRPKPVTTGSVVLSRVDTPKDKLAGWLTSRFTLGEQVSIHTILVRFSTDHPDEPAPPRMTLSRAMKAANFRKSGKDPADKRLPLWARVGSPDSPKDIVMLSSDVGMVRTFAGGAQ